MLEQLKIREGKKILVVGVDSVYILAALSRIYKQVYLVDAHKIYSEWAIKVLKNTGINNVFARLDGETPGWIEKAPFPKSQK
jgi:protein-L-isoaspartate O-methyltransferase